MIRESLINQIKRSILSYIFRENLSKGDRLPSMDRLAEMFSVGKSTVREAVRSLEQLHILETHQGKGTFVAVEPSSLGRDISQLRSVTEMARDSGINLINLRVKREEIQADAFLAQRLMVTVGTPVVFLRRVRGVEGEPLVYLEDMLPKSFTIGFSDEDWNGSLFQALEKNGVFVAFSRAKIVPYYPDKDFMKKVGLKHRVLFLLLQHTHYDTRGRVVAFSNDYYRSDFFHFEVLRKRL